MKFCCYSPFSNIAAHALKRGRSCAMKQTSDSKKFSRSRESVDVYGFQVNQVVLFAVIWCASFASAYSRSFAVASNRRRRSHGDRIAYSSTAGFAAVCILGIVSMAVGSEYFDSHGIVWVCIATGIGALGEEQHTLMRSMLLGLLQTLTKKQQDDETK